MIDLLSVRVLMIPGRGKQHKCTLDIYSLFHNPESIAVSAGGQVGKIQQTDFEEMGLRHFAILSFDDA